MTSKLLVSVCVMAACLVFSSTVHAANVTVPNVVGMPGLDANKAIQKVGLNPQYSMEATPTPDKTKADKIVKQEPASGRSVPAGSVVTLYVYMYQPAAQTTAQPQQPQAKPQPQPQPVQIKVPDVVGMKSADAYKTLEGAGFHHADGIVTFATPDKNKLYTIAKQDPPAGQYAKPGQVVALAIYNVVSAPPVPKSSMPNVLRMDLAQAKTALQRVGFSKYRILNAYTPVKADVGKVLAQSPQPGVPYPTSDEISLSIGTYKQ
jgi:beta-lactam-binding protein with PASTA domain